MIITAGQTVTLPVATPHKDVVVKQYKSIRIEAGGKLTTSAPNCGLVLKCLGDCLIDGTIDQSEKGGQTNFDSAHEYPAIMCGRGGAGGNGARNYADKNTNSYINGGTGGAGAQGRVYGGGFSGSGGGGAGGFAYYHSAYAAKVGTAATAADNISFSSPGKGGAGGNKGGTNHGGDGGSGGYYGGGILLLYVGGVLINRGWIQCHGIDGNPGEKGMNGYIYTSTSPASTVCGGSGGGGGGGSGGGAIYICHNKEYLGAGILNVNGGRSGSGGLKGEAGGAKGGYTYGFDGSSGIAGSIGQVMVVKFKRV